MKCEQYFLKVKDKLNNKKFRGELRSGLSCCNQNQNIPSSNHLLDTQQSLGAQASLQGLCWPLHWNYTKAVINMELVRLLPPEWPKVGCETVK